MAARAPHVRCRFHPPRGGPHLQPGGPAARPAGDRPARRAGHQDREVLHLRLVRRHDHGQAGRTRPRRSAGQFRLQPAQPPPALVPAATRHRTRRPRRDDPRPRAAHRGDPGPAPGRHRPGGRAGRVVRRGADGRRGEEVRRRPGPPRDHHRDHARPGNRTRPPVPRPARHPPRRHRVPAPARRPGRTPAGPGQRPRGRRRVPVRGRRQARLPSLPAQPHRRRQVAPGVPGRGAVHAGRPAARAGRPPRWPAPRRSRWPGRWKASSRPGSGRCSRGGRQRNPPSR